LRFRVKDVRFRVDDLETRALGRRVGRRHRDSEVGIEGLLGLMAYSLDNGSWFQGNGRGFGV